MAYRLVQEKRVPVMIVGLREGATRRLVRREIRQAHSVEPAAPRLVVEKRPAQRATPQRTLFARRE